MSALERKKPAADLRRSYIINIQVGLILSLLAFITMFKANLDFTGDIEILEEEQEIIEMEEVIQTEQETTPPPPPRPPQPEPVPDDEIVEDQFFDLDADMDIDDFDMPPPPPPEEEEEEEEPELFQVVEDMPEPVGGMQAIYDNLIYPEAARRAGIEGRVIIQFIVDENGQVGDFQVVRGIGGGTEQAAIEAIQSVEWSVGRQRGRAVRVQFQLPIMFRLQN